MMPFVLYKTFLCSQNSTKEDSTYKLVDFWHPTNGCSFQAKRGQNSNLSYFLFKKYFENCIIHFISLHSFVWMCNIKPEWDTLMCVVVTWHNVGKLQRCLPWLYPQVCCQNFGSLSAGGVKGGTVDGMQLHQWLGWLPHGWNFGFCSRIWGKHKLQSRGRYFPWEFVCNVLGEINARPQSVGLWKSCFREALWPPACSPDLSSIRKESEIFHKCWLATVPGSESLTASERSAKLRVGFSFVR